MAPFLGEPQRTRVTNTGRRARDERDLTLEPTHKYLLMLPAASDRPLGLYRGGVVCARLGRDPGTR